MMSTVITQSMPPYQHQAAFPQRAPDVMGSRVMVLDDELPIRMLSRMLQAWGYKVRHVGSAAEALAMMAVDPPDVVLCDVQKPECDGLWLLKRIKSEWPRTEVMMCTGTRGAQTIQTSRTLCAMAYVTKPFDPDQLRGALDQAQALVRVSDHG